MSILCQLRKEQLFTSSEMEVVNYIVTHPKTAVKATIRELAELTYSSPSTIGRVCKKVGVEGFTELKIKLATELDRLVVESKNADVNIPVGPEDRVEDFPRIFFNLHYQALSDAYHTVDIKVLKNVADVLYRADAVYVLGSQQSLVLAMDFLAVGVFQAAGKGNLALFMAICRKVILEIPFMFLFDRLWPMYGLGFSQFAAEFIMTIIGTVLLVRFLHQTERSVHDQTA
jgi:hypothetical protein